MATLYEPARHDVHTALVKAPALVENVPAEQLVHTVCPALDA